MVAPPHEQAGQIQAVVGVQVRQQDLHFAGIGVALQRSQDAAAEVDHQRAAPGALSRYPDAGESGPTTLPEQPSTVIRTVTTCHAQ